MDLLGRRVVKDVAGGFGNFCFFKALVPINSVPPEQEKVISVGRVGDGSYCHLMLPPFASCRKH